MSFAAPDSSCAVFLCKRFFPPPTHIHESVLPANGTFIGRTDSYSLPLERTRHLRHRNKAVLPDIFSPRRLPPPFPSLPAFSAYPSAPCSALPPFPMIYTCLPPHACCRNASTTILHTLSPITATSLFLVN